MKTCLNGKLRVNKYRLDAADLERGGAWLARLIVS